ncbi:MAG: hypothetical protein AVDCRST_MAG52-1531 [uncultured Blastococcus sp.]|uniref:Uncharacterized protein n=1 Tax=uncultured Blastococcus sp. TaxID=217144 RepID=A0A6J4HZY8_9ACTN|nr:MAG: hypothetical protein AVDCRST_MAG52-1531 [uncultured Blastococcus sp.]
MAQAAVHRRVIERRATRESQVNIWTPRPRSPVPGASDRRPSRP